MGKKDKKKKKDPEKLAALQAKKDAKAEKAARKRLDKEQRALDEAAAAISGSAGDTATTTEKGEDIDALLESYRQQSEKLANPVIESLDPPGSFPYPPRANFTLTVCPDGDMVMFGGEHYDGVENVVFDELLRWNPDAKPLDNDDNDDDEKKENSIGGEWKRILSPPPHPPARCSHTTVLYNNALYIFGGEYATSDQYHHYRDLWKFDLKSNTWEEIRPASKKSPAPRSGHRAIVWRHYMIVFGGFYEALRETKWYNDLHVWDFQSRTWTEMVYSKLASVPPARSAFNFGLISSKSDLAFVFGGYSKLKNPAPGSRAEGKVHTDCWALNLKPILQGNVPTWDRCSRKGEYPSPRSGTACVASYKNTRMLVYGGVYDDEGDHHKIESVFYDDLFAFDMERRRWFSMPLKKKGDGGGGRRRRKKDDDDKLQEEENEDDDDEDSIDDGDEKKEGEAHSSGWDLGKLRSNMFAFIDGEGNIVYEKIEEDEEEKEKDEEEAKEKDEEKHEETDVGYEADTGETESKLQAQTEKLSLQDKPQDISKRLQSGGSVPKSDTDTEVMHRNSSFSSFSPPLSSNVNPATVPTGAICSSEVMQVNAKTGLPESVSRTAPLPRINAAAVVRSNTLYVYGGLLEVGDREVTLDDCWTLDLHKRDGWTCLFPGTMHKQVWRGAESDNESYVSTDRGGDEDLNYEEEDESDEEQNVKEGGDMNPEDEAAIKAAKKAAKKEKKKEKKRGIRDEIANLKGQLDLDDPNRTPMMGEAMADFYSRTTDYWNQKATEKAVTSAESANEESESGATSSGGEKLSAKELKREGFQLARERYEELKPVLERLNELDAQQREAEEGKKSKDKKKKSRDKSSKEKKRGK